MFRIKDFSKKEHQHNDDQDDHHVLEDHCSGYSPCVGGALGLSGPPLEHVRDDGGGGGVVVEGGAQRAHRL